MSDSLVTRLSARKLNHQVLYALVLAEVFFIGYPSVAGIMQVGRLNTGLSLQLFYVLAFLVVCVLQILLLKQWLRYVIVAMFGFHLFYPIILQASLDNYQAFSFSLLGVFTAICFLLFLSLLLLNPSKIDEKAVVRGSKDILDI